MNCPVTLQTDYNCGHIKQKMVNHYKNPYHKETNFDNIVDQLCTRLQDIKDNDKSTKYKGGIHMRTFEPTDAVRRYCAAFPALNKGEDDPLQYYLPPPAWCRKNQDNIKMQTDLPMSKDFNLKSKKFSSGKERRNSYHGHRKGNKKRCNSYSRSFESKENLPEWVTSEGVWDIETQDPVKEFIRAIAMDEGYGTCENTVTDDIREITQVNIKMNENKVPDWDDSLIIDAGWAIADDLKPEVRTPLDEELYAKFEAKFDSSLEALWSKDQANTPDDEYQDLPIDFHDLLSSPSDNLFLDPSAEKCSLISLTESIWSNDARDSLFSTVKPETPTRSVEVLHDRFKPLNIADTACEVKPKTPIKEIEPFSLYSYEGIYEAVPSVADVMRSLTAINHSKSHSSFTEVLPRRAGSRERASPRPPGPSGLRPPPAPPARDDALTSARTHFRPIRREAETVDVSDIVKYADGDTFDINGDLDEVDVRQSESGFLYVQVDGAPKRYLEYRTRSIDYGRLKLTDDQRRGNDMEDDEFRLRFELKQIEVACQTEEGGAEEDEARAAWGGCEDCAGTGAKKMRADMQSIWSGGAACKCAADALSGRRPGLEGDEGEEAAPPELARDWEELMRELVLATSEPEPGAPQDRKRRRAGPCAAAAAACPHPHAPFLRCAGEPRPLTR